MALLLNFRSNGVSSIMSNTTTAISVLNHACTTPDASIARSILRHEYNVPVRTTSIVAGTRTVLYRTSTWYSAGGTHTARVPVVHVGSTVAGDGGGGVREKKRKKRENDEYYLQQKQYQITYDHQVVETRNIHGDTRHILTLYFVYSLPAQPAPAADHKIHKRDKRFFEKEKE